MESLRITAFVILASLFWGCGSVQFKTMSLDSGLSNGPQEDNFEYFRSPVVFTNSSKDMWGMEKDGCKDFKVVDLGGERQQSIQLDWNKTSCDWVGFGIGWDGYNPKDLSSITNDGAFILEMRAIKNEATIPTLIFLLEDYGTIMSAGVFGASCIESYPINEQWQTCVLPLSEFDLDESGIDLTNIKQLVVECQGAGNVIIDNIRIGKASDYPRPERETMAPSLVKAEPVSIYENGFAGAWGLGEMQGRSFKESQLGDNTFLDM
ncbi:MAG: hypothetical protein HRT74_10020, partial [Flavobacteriales bacterium]|nr:hypothetical protein [Flavobacteriales bacterium]